MYALLGDIQFDLITYFDSFEADFGTDYAEHAVIDGKPRLQYMGDRLDEIRIELSFHASFCHPETELARLKNAVSSHEAMALVLGNGDYKGWFVLTDVQSTSGTDESASRVRARQTDRNVFPASRRKYGRFRNPAGRRSGFTGTRCTDTGILRHPVCAAPVTQSGRCREMHSRPVEADTTDHCFPGKSVSSQCRFE